MPFRSFAFPEMIRHGYGNCISCHQSPTGGGILTAYGRALSREVLSTWGGKEGEESFIHAAMPEWLSLGGDLRTLNIRRETAVGSRDQLILMQLDLEAAVSLEKWTAVGTFGRVDTAIFPEGSSWISRRHFLIYRPKDEFSFRAGRFNRAFGINTADHFTAVKDGLQWIPGTETYAIEGAWLSDKYNIYLTGDFGRPDDKTLNRESGTSATGSYFFGERYKVGLSYFFGTNDFASRHVFGPWAIIGFSPHFFLLTELDFQRREIVNSTDATTGFANYTRLDYEPFQGFHVFGTAEMSRLDFQEDATRLLRYGVGLQFFPLPHFELEVAWQTQQALAASREFRDLLWFMFHAYL